MRRIRWVVPILFLLVGIGAGEPAATQNEQWLEVKNENIRPAILGISGMALWKETRDSVSLVVVHDNKKENEPRVGILTLRQNQNPQYVNLEWPGSLPIDFEAIAAVPGRPAVFVALTSAGRAFAIQIVERNPTAPRLNVLKIDTVPDGPEYAEREGFDLQVVNNVVVALWADRGCRAPCLESATPRPATLIWSRFDRSELKFLDRGPVKDRSQTLNVEFPQGPCVRPVSDLKIAKNGKVFVSAARECENDDTKLDYQSAAYEIGTLRFQKSRLIFQEQRPHRSLAPRITNYKIEALEFLPRRKGRFIFGTDDELRGGRIFAHW